MTRGKIALFGGTFDPVHWGHLLLAEYARTSYHLSRVLFVPTGLPPHKIPPIAGAAHRLRMLRLATASNPSFEVSDWEIRQKRTVYAVETLAHFRPDYFIVGTDMLKTLKQWKEGPSLLKQYVFLAAVRPGVAWAQVPADVRRNARRIDWPAVPLASRAIRARVRQGKSIRYEVPEAVDKYIRKYRLYL